MSAAGSERRATGGGADGERRATAGRGGLGDGDAATLAAIVDRMFPAGDDLPAASALGVVDYVDGQLAGPWGGGSHLYREPPFATPDHGGHGWQWDLDPREAYAEGLAALRRHAIERHGAPFEELDGERQDELLRDLQAGALEPFATMPSEAFFALLQANVVEGLLTDPRHGGNRDGAVWTWIGFPG